MIEERKNTEIEKTVEGIKEKLKLQQNCPPQDMDDEEIEKGKIMAIISYIVPIIPYLSEKKNKYVKFHARQGMNLFLVFIIYTVVYNILTNIIKVNQAMYRGGVVIKVTPWWVTFPLAIIGCALSIMDIIALVWAWNGETRELPVIKNLKIFK